MAESILNSIGKTKFKAFSAGSRPAGSVNPLALELLAKNRLPTEGLRSKDWSEFSRSGRTVPAFCLHGVRSGGGGSLPGLARPADDRALGGDGPGGGSRQR